MAPLPFLDWPVDLFAGANIAAKIATGRTPHALPRTNESNCACGCNQKHNRAVSGLAIEDDQRRVFWFRTMACKNQLLGVLQGMS